MRIVEWNDFVKYPAGTFYYQDMGSKNDFDWGSLMVKGDTIYNEVAEPCDYFELDTSLVDDNGSQWDVLLCMQESGVSQPLNERPCREGTYEYQGTYLIYEHDDLLQLKSWLDEAIKVAKPKKPV